MIFSLESMGEIFKIFEITKGVEQMEVHHPEGDVFNHLLQVLKIALRETDDIDLILAAWLHDVGKVENSKGHEKISCTMLKGLISVKSLWLIEHHMRIWGLILGEMKRKGKVEYLIQHPWLPELVFLARFDKLGRSKNNNVIYDKEVIVERLNKKIIDKYKEE